MPKDGPSAGVTMFTALVSLLTGIRVRHDVAMTGEITLRGRVLPIGGLKEKVLAAHRAGIKRVLVPERNKADLDEVPAEVKNDLEFVFVSKMDQVLEARARGDAEAEARRREGRAADASAVELEPVRRCREVERGVRLVLFFFPPWRSERARSSCSTLRRDESDSHRPSRLRHRGRRRGAASSGQRRVSGAERRRAAGGRERPRSRRGQGAGARARPCPLTTDPEAVLGDPSIDVFVEVMGGVNPTRSYVERAIDTKRSVVTANKMLLAMHGPALVERAIASGRRPRIRGIGRRRHPRRPGAA